MSPQYPKPHQHQQHRYSMPSARPNPSRASQNRFEDIKTGGWDAHLFGCFSHLVPNCCMVSFLPCISLAQIITRLGMMSYPMALLLFFGMVVLEMVVAGIGASLQYGRHIPKLMTRLQHWDIIAKYAPEEFIVMILLYLLYFFVMFVIIRLRFQIRKMFQIPGNLCFDCLAVCCCACCSVAQMATHVKSYKPGSCSFGAPDVLQAYHVGV